YGSNLLRPEGAASNILVQFLAQFKSPIILLLIFAAGLSFFLHQRAEGVIILAIIFVSGMLGFWQEHRASDAVEKLLAIVRVKADVLRDGTEKEIPVEEVMPGDIVILNAGDIIPGDALILKSKDLFVNEAALTGETYPADKMPAVLPEDTPLARRINSVFMGTSVVSGTATVVIVHTGAETEFGRVSQRLSLVEPETEFEQGVRHFGYLLMEVTLILVVAIFAINVYFQRPVVDSFLFSLALAVGLTPQLLPAIISINLAHGARRMAAQKVIVKRLASIENFGSMNVLCSDKTGTLTEGKVKLDSALDVAGKESQEVFLYAYINSFFETGFKNPIDEAILDHGSVDVSGFKKLDEVPYDFIRKRLSILVSAPDGVHTIVTKGALAKILEVCTTAQTDQGSVDIDQVRDQIEKKFEELSAQGFRVLGISIKKTEAGICLTRDEADMMFLGFLAFFDPPKADIGETIKRLNSLGISLKVITGDNLLVARSISRQVGLEEEHILTGRDLRDMSDEALLRQVQDVEVFAEIEPNQKERIILALRKFGDVVGYVGDGINDASALHAADIGISVDSAVDVAKEAADIVLLEKDLSVLSEGVIEGRRTFSNTMKYVFMATSANFGNMFSMAVASLFLPFLPLLPTQVLLTNLLTDLPEMTIAGDSVDPELIDRPRRWSISFIRNFMVVFGLLSSIFDYATFGVLLFVLHANVDQFRTGWFMESVISASIIVLVIRTRRTFIRSKPSNYLVGVTLMVVLATVLIPFSPLAVPFGFIRMPPFFLATVAVIVAVYIISADLVKRWFYRKVKY
ncbi:MAG TPA: magnesium-translocating P-type ATPase, partial [Methanotrichaceae archaeon]|nr:magnesium-translocating P-type ATPase [Methanotrichaceae archaeon]